MPNRTPHTVGGGIGSVKIRAVREATIRAQHTATVSAMARVAMAAEVARVDAEWRQEVGLSPQPTYGMCTRCGAIEAALDHATGTRDFSEIGESAAYPTGFGCEYCS